MLIEALLGGLPHLMTRWHSSRARLVQTCTVAWHTSQVAKALTLMAQAASSRVYLGQMYVASLSKVVGYSERPNSYCEGVCQVLTVRMPLKYSSSAQQGVPLRCQPARSRGFDLFQDRRQRGRHARRPPRPMSSAPH